jgi:hypothetical protein
VFWTDRTGSILSGDDDTEYGHFEESSSEKLKGCYQGENVLDICKSKSNGHLAEPTPQIVSH